MFAVRSAMLLVALNFVLSLSAVSASAVCSRGAVDVARNSDHRSSIGVLDIAPLSDTRSFSRVPFRRSRLKAVLEETDHELEEVDLGPIPAPRGPSSHTSIAVSSPFFPRTSRLRC
jgi:hypothetical protein